MTATANAELDTFQIVDAQCSRCGRYGGMRHKDLGIGVNGAGRMWRGSALLRARLMAHGQRYGDKVANIGTNRPRLNWSDDGTRNARAVPVPFMPTPWPMEGLCAGPSKCASPACRTQEQVDKSLAWPETAAADRVVFYDEPRGLRDYDHSRLQRSADVISQGAGILASDPDAVRRLDEANPERQGFPISP